MLRILCTMNGSESTTQLFSILDIITLQKSVTHNKFIEAKNQQYIYIYLY